MKFSHAVVSVGLAVILLVAILTIAVISKAARSGKPDYTVLPETTFLTEPLRDDGSVDYLTFINKHSLEQVSFGNNACVGLFRALGPTIQGQEIPSEVFRSLEMASPLSNKANFKGFEELIAKHPEWSQHQNRFLAQSKEAISRPWKHEQFPVIAECINENGDALHAIQQATACNQFCRLLFDDNQFQSHTPLIALAMPELLGVTKASEMLRCRAMLHNGEGRHGDALTDLLVAYRLGLLVSHGPTVLDCLIGMGISAECFEAFRIVLNSFQLSSDEANRIGKALSEMPSIASVSERVNLHERCMHLDSLLTIAWERHDTASVLEVDPALLKIRQCVRMFPPGTSIDWDIPLRIINERCDRIVAAMRIAMFPERMIALRQINAEIELLGNLKQISVEQGGGKRDELMAEQVGFMMAQRYLPALAHARVVEDKLHQQCHLLSVVMAIGAFHADRGTYPNTLNQLRPKYIVEVPDDVFSNQPLVYRANKTGYVLFSIGENLLDEGGHSFSDDISFEIQ